MKTLIKLIKVGIIFGLIVALAVGLINIRMITLAGKYKHTVDEVPKADVALVLGALVYNSGRPSDILADRLDVGIELYKKGKVKKLLLSGDHGRKNYNEVESMKQYMLKAGVKEQDIFMDHAGFSTYESVYRAKEVFEVENMIVVTQKFHLSRAVYTARKLGIKAFGIPADKNIYRKMIIFQIREALARCKDFVLVNILDKKPTYLGEKINIMGDGTVTQD
ncbi:ElyC/SanA/YdcF family protein [Clostridiaceae bacterium M8S5]|nr:ElyC/SanA/YdcF family protein [Clostridiaceae bacterium M8S5]